MLIVCLGLISVGLLWLADNVNTTLLFEQLLVIVLLETGSDMCNGK